MQFLPWWEVPSLRGGGGYYQNLPYVGCFNPLRLAPLWSQATSHQGRNLLLRGLIKHKYLINKQLTHYLGHKWFCFCAFQ